MAKSKSAKAKKNKKPALAQDEAASAREDPEIVPADQPAETEAGEAASAGETSETLPVAPLDSAEIGETASAGELSDTQPTVSKDELELGDSKSAGEVPEIVPAAPAGDAEPEEAATDSGVPAIVPAIVSAPAVEEETPGGRGILRYGLTVILFSALALGAVLLGMSRADEIFTRLATLTEEAEEEPPAPEAAETAAITKPVSSLAAGNLDAAPPQAEAAEADGSQAAAEEIDSAPPADAQWVVVRRAVKMREGPGGRDPLVKVQPVGVRLQVTARKNKWLEVLDPGTGERGWIYAQFVEPSSPPKAAASGRRPGAR